MANLLQADAVQQLEVALLGSLVAQVVDLLSEGLTQAQTSTSAASVQPHPRFFTSTPPTTPPSLVPLVGISSSSQGPVSTYTRDVFSLPEMEVAKTSTDLPPWHIIPTLVESSSPASTTYSSVSASGTAFPIVVVPELAISAETYPKWINRLGGKDYLCCLCLFRHSNLNCILKHVRNIWT